MDAGVAVDASTVEHLAEEAERGRRYLEKFELPEAEEVFRGILQRLPIYHSVQTDRIIVASLSGLAEIHAKHCRSVRDVELDWLCGMLFALLFYRAAGEVCAKVMRHRKRETNSNSNGNGNGNGNDYFSDIQSRSKAQANGLEVCLLGALRDRVLEHCTPFPRPLVQRKASGFDDTWLDGLWEFCVRSAADYQIDYTANGPPSPQPNDNPRAIRRRYSLISRDGGLPLHLPSSHPVEEAAARTARASSPAGSESVQSSVSVPSVRRRINFDRFQDAIKHFVSDVSTDIRNKYMHISGKIPHGLLEQRVCSELALRMSQGSEDGEELQGIFESLLTDDDGLSMGTIDEEDMEEMTNQSQRLSSSDEDDDDDEEMEEEDEGVETIELYIKPSALHSGSKVAPPGKDLVLYANGPTAASNSALVPAKSRGKTPVAKLEMNASRNTRTTDLTVEKTNTSSSKDVRLPDNTEVFLPGVGGGGKNGVLTKWRGKPPSAGCHLLPWSSVGGFEEVSQFTEKKERVPWTATESEIGLHRYINESKLSQLLGSTSSKLADAFKRELRFMEACQLYKYAYGIFRGYPLVGGQQEMMARLLVDIGSTCCSVGELESGSQLMKEAAGLYEGSGETLRTADVWYQLGNAFLADNLRQESLLARMMQLTKEDLQEEDDLNDGSSICSSTSSSNRDKDDDDDDDTYCPCILEAIASYQRALEVTENLPEGRKDPDLLANVLSNLADCRLMTGSLDLAEKGYEEALHLFTSTFGNALLQKNAHVLCMLATLNFLSGNYVRAATLYETSHILRQHLPDVDEPTLEMTWCLTMLGLSYHFLGHYDQSIVWCIRSFKLYTRFFRGRLLTVDFLNRWFIIQNLYVLGFAGIILGLHKKALHYLNFCRNMMPESEEEEQDWDQSVRILLALGDAYEGLSDEANKLKYHAEAQERAQKLNKGTKAGAVLSSEVLYRLGGERKVGQQSEGRSRDRAVVKQQSMETCIKDDMVAILLKLGLTTGQDTDIDWAIGCYDDCVQGYRNLQEPREAARALSSLGTLCQVKGRMQVDDSKERMEFLSKAENYFREAFGMVDSSSPVWVQFGNFLYSEGHYAEALEVLLPFVFCVRPGDVELSYSGIEQMALPVHLHRNIQEEETLVVEARVLAKFLGLLCFRSLGLTRDADDALVEMYRSVVGEGSTKPLNYALLGYALLEARLFQEAAEAFTWSSWLQPESDLAYSNAWMSALLATYALMARGLDYVLQFLFQTEKDGLLSFQEKKSYLRRQASYRSRKLIRDASREEAMREVSNLRKGLQVDGSPATGSAPIQGTVENHDHRTETSLKDASMNHEDGLLSDHYPNCTTPSAKEAEEHSRRVALEARRWRRQQNSQRIRDTPTSLIRDGESLSPTGQQEEAAGAAGRPGSASRKKWRSRLYHNLPESPDSEMLLTDTRRPRIEQ